MEFTPVQLLALTRRQAKFSPVLAYMLAHDISLDIDNYLRLDWWDESEYGSLRPELQAEIPACLRENCSTISQTKNSLQPLPN